MGTNSKAKSTELTYEEAPEAKEVRIVNVDVQIERMSKSIIEKKLKEFREVEEREMEENQRKGDLQKEKKKMKGEKGIAKNKVKEEKKVSISASDSGSESNSEPITIKNPPKQKKKVLTKKKPRKSKDSSDESGDDNLQKQKLFSNPFFVNDEPEMPTKEEEEEAEKEKLVEMLYSLIKKEKNEKSS